jgi:hypothetical protein
MNSVYKVHKGKGKVVPGLKHHAMKTYWGSADIAPHILSLGTIRKRVVSFTFHLLCLRGRALGVHWIGGWVDPRVRLDAMAKRNNLIIALTRN